jgi:hypothetical protein
LLWKKHIGEYNNSNNNYHQWENERRPKIKKKIREWKKRLMAKSEILAKKHDEKEKKKIKEQESTRKSDSSITIEPEKEGFGISKEGFLLIFLLL